MKNPIIIVRKLYCHQLDWYIPWFGDTTVAHTVWPTRKREEKQNKN